MHLSDGTLWSIPIILDVSDEVRSQIEGEGAVKIELHDGSDHHIATLENIEMYDFDKEKFCESVF